jgi:hypothetical protein
MAEVVSMRLLTYYFTKIRQKCMLAKKRAKEEMMRRKDFHMLKISEDTKDPFSYREDETAVEEMLNFQESYSEMKGYINCMADDIDAKDDAIILMDDYIKSVKKDIKKLKKERNLEFTETSMMGSGTR